MARKIAVDDKRFAVQNGPMWSTPAPVLASYNYTGADVANMMVSVGSST